jgi:hypothetical protein
MTITAPSGAVFVSTGPFNSELVSAHRENALIAVCADDRCRDELRGRDPGAVERFNAKRGAIDRCAPLFVLR